MTRWRFVAPPPEHAVERGPVPTFSVIVAAHQAAATIGEAVKSALSQTRPPLEIVVCDDGSTDDIEGALAPFRDRIRLLRQAKAGLAPARNAAAAAASGEFVVILDADDVLYPERLEALGELAATRPDLDILTTNADIEVEGSHAGRYYPDIAHFPVSRQRLGVLESDCAVLGVAAVRRRKLLEAGGFDPTLEASSDWECWMRLVLDGALVGLVDEPLYRYHLRPTSLTGDRARSWRGCAQAVEKTLAHPKATEEDRAVLRRTGAHYRRLAMLTEAEGALRARHPDARRRALAVARGAGFPAVTRAKAAFAAAFPGAAARLLELRERRSGRSRLLRGVAGS